MTAAFLDRTLQRIGLAVVNRLAEILILCSPESARDRFLRFFFSHLEYERLNHRFYIITEISLHPSSLSVSGLAVEGIRYTALLLTDVFCSS